MSSFINNIIKQTFESTPLIQPRVRGKFEQDTNSSSNFFHDSSSESFQNNEISPEQVDDRSEIAEKVNRDSSGLIKKSNDSVNLGTSNNSFNSSQTQPSLITQLVSKHHYGTQKELKLSPANLIITPQPVSEKIVVDNRIVEELSDTGADVPSNGMKKAVVKPAKEIQALNTNDDNKTIMQDLKEQALPASHIQPLVLPVTELFSNPSTLKAGANYNFPSGSTLLKDDFKKRDGSFSDKFSQVNEATQTINISIGRVEVRVSQPPVQGLQAPKKEGIPIMSLDEYLDKKKHNGK